MSDRDERLQKLNRLYFALLKERRFGVVDRRVFQAGLHARGLIASESCTEWESADYVAAIHEVEQVEPARTI